LNLEIALLCEVATQHKLRFARNDKSRVVIRKE